MPKWHIYRPPACSYSVASDDDDCCTVDDKDSADVDSHGAHNMDDHARDAERRADFPVFNPRSRQTADGRCNFMAAGSLVGERVPVPPTSAKPIGQRPQHCWPRETKRAALPAERSVAKTEKEAAFATTKEAAALSRETKSAALPAEAAVRKTSKEAALPTEATVMPRKPSLPPPPKWYARQLRRRPSKKRSSSNQGQRWPAPAKEGIYCYSPGTSYDLDSEALVDFLHQRKFFDSRFTPDLARSYLANFSDMGMEAVLVARAPGQLPQLPGGVSFIQFASLIRRAGEVWSMTYAASMAKLFGHHESVRMRLKRVFHSYAKSFDLGPDYLKPQEFKEFCTRFRLVCKKLPLGELHMIYMACGGKCEIYGADGYKLNVSKVAVNLSGFMKALDRVAEILKIGNEELYQLVAMKAEALKIILIPVNK